MAKRTGDPDWIELDRTAQKRRQEEFTFGDYKGSKGKREPAKKCMQSEEADCHAKLPLPCVKWDTPGPEDPTVYGHAQDSDTQN